VQAARGTPLTGQTADAVTRERPRRVGLLLAVAALVVTADIISKVMVVARIPEQTIVHVIGNLLVLTQVRNGGAAFNIGGTSMTIVFTAIAVGVVIYILRAASNLRSTAWAITLGLLLGGATGNLIDRIFRAPGPFRGDVVDWIEVPHWPVFNVADSCIVCAGVLVVLLALRGIRPDGTRVPTYRAGGSPPSATSEPDYPNSTSEPDYPKSDYPEPDLLASDRLAPDRPDRLAPDRPDRLAPDRPDRLAPDRPDRLAPDRPDRLAPDRPDHLAPDPPTSESR
jgi:signal peptidase II